jgi:hypothetical protein
MPNRKYNTSVQVYSEGGNINKVENLTSFMFTNVGDVKATVNGMVINPAADPTTSIGDSRSISAHDGDVYIGNIQLRFDSVAGNPLVEIVQVYYED